LINALERVNTDNRIKMIVDPASDDGHDATPGACVKLRGSGAECVLGHQRGIFNCHLQHAAWIGGPHATVLCAKRAAAGPSWNFCGVRLPGEREADISAVTLTVDQHARSPMLRSLTISRDPKRTV